MIQLVSCGNECIIYRVHTNLTDTLESHTDIKNTPKPIIIEKGVATSIDMGAINDNHTEAIITDNKEERKKESKFGLFYRRHRIWFQ